MEAHNAVICGARDAKLGGPLARLIRKRRRRPKLRVATSDDSGSEKVLRLLPALPSSDQIVVVFQDVGVSISHLCMGVSTAQSDIRPPFMRQYQATFKFNIVVPAIGRTLASWQPWQKPPRLKS